MRSPIKILLENRGARRAAKKQKEFLAKLKHGEDWRLKLYPHKYTQGTGPR